MQEQLPDARRAPSGVDFFPLAFLTQGILPFGLRPSFAVRAAPAAQWPFKER